MLCNRGHPSGWETAALFLLKHAEHHAQPARPLASRRNCERLLGRHHVPPKPPRLHPMFFFPAAHLPCAEFPPPGTITPLLLKRSPTGPAKHQDQLCPPKGSPPWGPQGSPGERWEPVGPQMVLLFSSQNHLTPCSIHRVDKFN